MTEIGWLVLMVIAAALALIALAGWLLTMTAVRIARYAEMWFLRDKTNPGVLREPEKDKPPDAGRKPQARADEYEAPMVRRARERMEARMRREGYGG